MTWEEAEAVRLARARRVLAARRAAVERSRLPDGAMEDEIPVSDEDGPRVHGVAAPTSLGGTMGELVARMGWGDRLEAVRVHRAWADIVGPDLAGRSEPISLRDGRLRLRVESSAWAVELRHQRRGLVRQVAKVLEVTVTDVDVEVGPLRGRGTAGQGGGTAP